MALIKISKWIYNFKFNLWTNFLNKNLKVTGKIKYKINTRIHGIAIAQNSNCFI